MIHDEDPRVMTGFDPVQGHWPTHRCTQSEARRFEQLTRQRKKAIAFSVCLADLHVRFGGSGIGGPYWPVEMNRRQARAIARDQAKTNWRNS